MQEIKRNKKCGFEAGKENKWENSEIKKKYHQNEPHSLYHEEYQSHQWSKGSQAPTYAGRSHGPL